MSLPITSWLRAFFSLQTHATESRGSIEITTDDDEIVRWPRTTGSDAVAIAAVIDPILRAEPIRFGGGGLRLRWRMVVDALEDFALRSPDEPFAENQAFWRTLPAVFIYLHTINVPLPDPRIWDALAAQFRSPIDLRNIGPSGDGPFVHFDGIKTYDDLYRAQYKYLRDKRGADETAPPPGYPGVSFPIPRTTNADVLQLATYWSNARAKVKDVKNFTDETPKWKLIVADVDKLAKAAPPDLIYARNNEFWRRMKELAIQVAVSDEAPTKWDMVVESVKDSVKNLPENLGAGAKKLGSEVAELAAGAAHAVGKIANEAGKGAFAGFGTPLLIGAGLLGVFLISRNRDRPSRPSREA
ncbi:MAG: hypothetical protein NT062_10795 [Proteobacteria bacterium]|nr:hypothetical protein [Pseudomonadota bacterium]